LKAVFVFPPKASPTYLPLGVASLASYVRRQVPDCSFHVLDTNIAVWTRLAEKDLQGDALLRFVRGEDGDFFDCRTYERHLETWNRLSAQIRKLDIEAKRYLSLGTADSVFMALLDFQVDKILFSDPDLIGFSTIFLDQIPFALALAKRIREMQRIPARLASGLGGGTTPRIILGGAALSALHSEELLAACAYVDGLIEGEGEFAAAALCSGQRFEHVPGIVFRSDAGGLKRKPNAQTLSLRCLPSPDFSVLDYRRYFNPAPVIPVLFSRGCAWRKCRFCVHNVSFAGYRARSVHDFVSELQDYQSRYGVSHFYFADQYLRPADLEQMADLILKMDMKIHFHVMARPLEDWTPERAEKLSRAGCRWISWGVESGSQRLLDLINKGTTVEGIKQALFNAHGSGISNLIMMIYGLPRGTEADLHQTFRFLEDVYDSVEAVSSSSFVLWARSQFGRNARRYGIHVVGPRPLFDIDGTPIHSRALEYREQCEDGSLRPPRGSVEMITWQDRRKWLGDAAFQERLPCEHYLLYASHLRTCGSKPILPCRKAA
jgi:radical SAM superfamily enzyme YgiQ (UPF0313 family)